MRNTAHAGQCRLIGSRSYGPVNSGSRGPGGYSFKASGHPACLSSNSGKLGEVAGIGKSIVIGILCLNKSTFDWQTPLSLYLVGAIQDGGLPSESVRAGRTSVGHALQKYGRMGSHHVLVTHLVKASFYPSSLQIFTRATGCPPFRIAGLRAGW